jgi:hypothetical protein
MVQDAHLMAYGPPMSICKYCERYVPRSLRTCACGYKIDHPAISRPSVFQPFFDSSGQIHALARENDDKSLQIQIPEFLSNPAHVAHIVWLYCQCVPSLCRSNSTN